MDRNLNCTVVKFHDGEEYAVSVVSGKREECLRKAAYFRGIFKEYKLVHFEVYPSWYIDALEKIDRQGGSSLYELLQSTTIN